MKTHHVKGCIEALKALRAEKRQELSTSVVQELDAVIQILEYCCENAGQEVEVSKEQRSRILELLSQVLAAATNLTDLIQTFFDNC